MNLVKKHNRFYQVLGVGAALLVPALAVGLEIPNSFKAGTPVRAADMNENFKAIADEVSALREELDELKGRLEPGTRAELGQLDATNTTAIYQVKSTGLVTVVPAGSGYGSIGVGIHNGDAVGSDDWTLECDGEACPLTSRNIDGNSTTALIKANTYFRVYQEGASSTGHARIVWLPLYGEDAANGKPTLIRLGAP